VTRKSVACSATNDFYSLKRLSRVRIASQKAWNNGLFIADFAQIPFGCSTWPAYWHVGLDWPNGGAQTHRVNYVSPTRFYR